MTLIDGDRIVTAQLYDDEHEEFTEKKMSIIDYVNAYTDEGVTTADDVLDKIRAEISSLIAEYDARCERFPHKPYKPTKGFPENGVAPRNPIEIESRKWGERAEGLERALKIIDKYKAESEARNDRNKINKE